MNRIGARTTVLALALAVSALTGCASSPILLNRAIVRNETGGRVTQVLVRHEPTGRIGRISAIQPQSEFDLGFARQPMKAKRAEVSWQDSVGAVRTVELRLPRKGTEATSTLVYTLRFDGTITVHLE